MALLATDFAKQVIPADIREQVYALWIDSAGKSLEANQTTLAIVPLARLTREGGYLERLRAKGYLVEPPK